MNDPIESLRALRNKEESFDLILTEVHLSKMSGIEFLKHFQEESNGVPVVLMSADDDPEIMRKGLEEGAAFYYLKPLILDNLFDLWQIIMSYTSKGPSIESSSISLKVSSSNTSSNEHERLSSNTNHNDSNVNYYNSGSNCSLDLSDINFESKKNDTDLYYSKSKGDGISNGKGVKCKRRKPKIIWTASLHNLFLEALYRIGVDKAVPTKILEYMKVPTLKRENVASHLQKYRIFMKRISRKKEQGVNGDRNERPVRSNFMINEITYLTNILQQQYHELFAESRIKGQNDIHRIIVGDTNFENKKTINETNATIVMKDEPVWKGSRGDYIRSNNGSNYVGLRINSNGELVGTLRSMPSFIHGIGNLGNMGVNIGDINTNPFINTHSSQMTPPYLSLVDYENLEALRNANVMGVDDLNINVHAVGEASQLALNVYEINDEVGQISMDMLLDEESFGSRLQA